MHVSLAISEKTIFFFSQLDEFLSQHICQEAIKHHRTPYPIYFLIVRSIRYHFR